MEDLQIYIFSTPVNFQWTIPLNILQNTDFVSTPIYYIYFCPYSMSNNYSLLSSFPWDPPSSYPLPSVLSRLFYTFLLLFLVLGKGKEPTPAIRYWKCSLLIKPSDYPGDWPTCNKVIRPSTWGPQVTGVLLHVSKLLHILLFPD